MPQCHSCGNDYDGCMQISRAGVSHFFDSFECAIHALAPTCTHCGCKVIGHGVESDGKVFCCSHCASQKGVTGTRDEQMGWRPRSQVSQIKGGARCENEGDLSRDPLMATGRALFQRAPVELLRLGRAGGACFIEPGGGGGVREGRTIQEGPFASRGSSWRAAGEQRR